MNPTMFDAVSALVEGQLSGGTTYESFIYHDGQTPPTEEAIQAKLKELENEYEKQAYARSRADAYPSWQTQLDQLFHQGYDGWKAEVQKVKDQFPKP